MSAEEAERSEVGHDDGGGAGGPGAPTPLSALEVNTSYRAKNGG